MPRELAIPVIGYFNIGARDGDTWCLPISAEDGGDDEWPEEFLVELTVSDINVVVARKKVTVTVIREEGIYVFFCYKYYVFSGIIEIYSCTGISSFIKG